MSGKVINVTLNDRTVEMLDKIREHTGIDSRANIVRLAILNLHRVYFKDYIREKPDQPEPVVEDLKEKKTQEQILDEKRCNICEALGGEIIDKKGIKSCAYTVYEKVNSSLVSQFETQIPFSLLNESYLKDQYTPSKEECLKILKKK